jgi:SAM-dependent methyltransferase
VHEQEATSYRRESLETWQAAAPAWERERPLLWEAARGVSEWMVAGSDPQPGERVLELACGSGDTGFLAAARIGPTGHLLSTDQAPGMVDGARRRAAELGLTNVESRTLDAEQMDLPDRSFDVVLCRWGYMLMLDPLAALRETRRVLDRDGRLALAVWTDPSRNPWTSVIAGVLVERELLPKPDPTGPGMFRLGDPAVLEALIRDAGFDSVELEEIEVGWRFASFDELWRVFTSLSSVTAAALGKLDNADVGELRAEAERRCQPYRAGEGLVLPGVSLGAVAR